MASSVPKPPIPTRSSTLGSPICCFTNCQLCISGELIPGDLYFSPSTGLITPNYYYRTEGVERIDLGGRIVAPGFLELQANGRDGVRFSELGKGDSEGDERKLEKVARAMVRSGVTGWWATVPSVRTERWKEILPFLTPRTFPGPTAPLLGAHVEGPYLSASHAGAHDPSHFTTPLSHPNPLTLFPQPSLSTTIKLLTLSPALPSTPSLISTLLTHSPHLRISLGHSPATYAAGLAALAAGASALTHVFNAMSPLRHRDPGLPGLVATGKCWYSIIPDGVHVHPAVLTIALRTDPMRCILITDSVELAGLPDGVYPSTWHGATERRVVKMGPRVVVEGTETLAGSVITLDDAVRNMVSFTGCGLAEAVRCVTENVAAMMGEGKRGKLEGGRRADLVVLSKEGCRVEETWVGGVKVWWREMDGEEVMEERLDEPGELEI